MKSTAKRQVPRSTSPDIALVPGQRLIIVAALVLEHDGQRQFDHTVFPVLGIEKVRRDDGTAERELLIHDGSTSPELSHWSWLASDYAAWRLVACNWPSKTDDWELTSVIDELRIRLGFEPLISSPEPLPPAKPLRAKTVQPAAWFLADMAKS